MIEPMFLNSNDVDFCDFALLASSSRRLSGPRVLVLKELMFVVFLQLIRCLFGVGTDSNLSGMTRLERLGQCGLCGTEFNLMPLCDISRLRQCFWSLNEVV